MDVLTKMSLDHGSVYESLAIFKNLSAAMSENDQAKRTAALKNFLNDIILPHFVYEEDNVIPVVLEYGDPAEKKVTQEIKQEHVEIIKKINEFMALTAAAGAGPAETTVLALILRHARKEDVYLFPAFKKYYKV
jgi:hemerythrin-like domain-containing protein